MALTRISCLKNCDKRASNSVNNYGRIMVNLHDTPLHRGKIYDLISPSMAKLQPGKSETY